MKMYNNHGIDKVSQAWIWGETIWGRMYLNIIGFGENGYRVYDSSSQKPLCWPETLSFEAFKGPNYATIKEANLILESILDELNDIDIHEH